MAEDPAATGWHLDRRVPIALIFAIFAQTVGIVWWASSIEGRVQTLEARSIERSDLSGRITRQEALMEGVQAGVNRIEDKLDRLFENRR